MNFLIRFFFGISFSLIIEVPLLFLLSFLWNRRDFSSSHLKTILSGVLATTLSYPYLQCICLPLCSILIEDRGLTKAVFFLVGELMVVLIEWLIYRGVLGLGWRKALLFSFICNLASFLLGLLFFKFLPF